MPPCFKNGQLYSSVYPNRIKQKTDFYAGFFRLAPINISTFPFMLFLFIYDYINRINHRQRKGLLAIEQPFR